MKMLFVPAPSPATRAARRSGTRAPSLAVLSALALLLAACATPAAPPIAPPAAASAVTQAGSGDEEAGDEAEEAGAADTGGAGQGRAAQAPVEPLPTVELTPQIMYQVLASEIAAQRGQVDSAAATYLSMARQTRDPRFARRATEFALAERSIERALPAARLWYELAPTSPAAARTIESLWLSTGRYEQAEPLLRARLEHARAEHKLAQAYAQLQRALARTADPKAALEMLERLAAPDAGVVAARLALASVAHTGGDNVRAAAEAEAALALDATNEAAAIAAARYVAGTPRGNPGAVRVLEKFLQRQPKAAEARFLLARLLAADGRNEAARAQFEAALGQEPDSPAILFSLAQLAHQMKQPTVAAEYLQRYLALPAQVQRDDDPAYLFLGQIAEEARRYDEALGWYEKVGRRDDQFLPALTRRAVILGKTGRVEEARELLRGTSVSSARERALLTSAEAQVLREAGRDADAYAVLDEALSRTPENTELLYDHAMAAERLDKLDVMEADLRKLMSLRPDYAHAYNALGYTFADRNIRLDEAQQLIEKALSLAPDDAQIIDSLGWVLFRRGQFAPAIEQLQKAWRLLPEPEIGAHLGEALFRAGRVDEARRIWAAAAATDPDNATLKATLARFKAAQ